MDASQFSPLSPGYLVPVPGTRPDAAVAFVPAPLPPAWRLADHLWPALIEARTTLARLDGTGRHIPNPALLLRPLARRESQLSSQLEGTFTDPHDQTLYEAEPALSRSWDDPANALREVHNYNRALHLRHDGPNDLPLSLRLIRQFHAVLLEGVRGSDQYPGEFRRTQNQIGRPARYVPPPPYLLAEVLDSFEKYLHQPSGLDPLLRAFLVHYQFEAIHPFSDGNGRVGRLLLALTVTEWCGLAHQWLYMSPWLEARKDLYMQRLLAVSTHADWDGWISFCLQGAAESAHDTLHRCDRLLALHKDYHARVKGHSLRLGHLIDSLFHNPTITVARYRDLLQVTYPTARADLRLLDRLGILTELPGRHQITYYSPQIFQVSYE